jgi:DNA primase
MGKGITESTVEEIKSRIDLADLISSYGIAVKHAGSSLKACCPFHNEKTPSFHINDTKGFYHCFGCGESGDAIKFVQKMEGVSFVEAVKNLASRCGVEIAEKDDPEAGKRRRLYALMAELAQFYRRCLLKTREAQLAREYLQKRNLGEAVQEEFLIGYAPNGMSAMVKWAEKYGYTLAELEAAGVIKPPRDAKDSGYHRFGSRLMFTICDKQGRVVAFSGRQLVANRNSGKYVNSPETAIFKKSNVLFGFDKASGFIARSPRREVILCEGQIDVIRLHVCGFRNAVASQGTAFTDEHAKAIRRVADCAVLMYDDDAAGRKAAVATARKLLQMEMPVRVVSLPDGADPDSFLIENGPDALQSLIDKARSIIDFQFETEKDKEDGSSSLDALNRISKSLLQTIASCPSAILQAGMVDEAARFLSLPAAALSEELSKIIASARNAPKTVEVTEPQIEVLSADGCPEPYEDEIMDDAEFEGAAASDRHSPSIMEFAFMEFLLTREYDADFAATVAGILPGDVFNSDFTRRFVDTWREEASKNEDLFTAFAEKLSSYEREWFDKIYVGAGKTEASALTSIEILRDFACKFWIERLKRERNSVSLNADVDSEIKRMRLSMDIKHLTNGDWNVVAGLIKNLMKGEK